MQRNWIRVALLIGLFGVIAFSAFREFARPSDFNGCFDYNGRKLVFGQGRLLVDGADIGSFRHSHGDATKGADTITVGATPTALTYLGLDARRIWRLTDDGLQLPVISGAYETARPCLKLQPSNS